MMDNPSTASFAIGAHGLISSTTPGALSAAVRGENRGAGVLGVGFGGDSLDRNKT